MNGPIPSLSINGTSSDSLIQDLCDANLQIGALLEALQKCAPNGRDYSPADFKLAQALHASRVERILSVQKEIVGLYEAISDAADAISTK